MAKDHGLSLEVNGARFPTDMNQPWVVAVNRLGWRRELEPTTTEDEARSRIQAIERDLNLLSLVEWCEKYQVPRAFVDAKGGGAGAATEPPTTSERSVEYDLHNWSPADIVDTLAQIREQTIPYSWDDSDQLLIVPAKYEQATNKLVLGEASPRVEVPGGFIPLVEVPGGFIGIDPYRGQDDFVLMIRNLGAVIAAGGYTARGVLRDIVVFDSHKRELFRQGPYNAINVQVPYGRIVAEIRKSGGVQEFVRSRQVAEGQIGPVRITSGRMSVPDWLSFFWTLLKPSIFRKPKRP